MTPPEIPRVVVVDDQPESVHSHLLELHESEILDLLVRAPDEVFEEDLVGAKVVLVDYRIDDWPGRDELIPVSLKPLDGLALAAVLRSHFARLEEGTAAIALNAANLDELATASFAGAREEVIAHTHNLEWAFRKASGNGPGIVRKETQILSLAKAVNSLPTEWPTDDQAALRQVTSKLLALPVDSSWAEQAWEDVEFCRPPIHEVAPTTHGLAFLRWLLHRILPYPCFLYSDVHLAHSLRVTPESLRRALSSSDGKLTDCLAEFQFEGILDGFLGHQWWKAGVEHLLWTLTEGEPFDRRLLARAVKNQLSSALVPVEQPHPVVCVDERLRISDSFHDRSNAVEIQPDDWPSYARAPWVPLELAQENRALGSLVVDEDRERLSPPAAGQEGE